MNKIKSPFRVESFRDHIEGVLSDRCEVKRSIITINPRIKKEVVELRIP